MSTENCQLRAKIDEAKRRLPLPELMRRLGHDEKHIGKTALCPFHSDEHPSFSVFEGNDGWQHKCFIGCSSGDEIAFLEKALNVSRREAINRYLNMAGFPTCPTRESREYPESRASRKSLESPKSPKSPESPCVSVSPVYLVSEGHCSDKKLEKELKGLATRNACTRPFKPLTRAGDRERFELARHVRAVEERIGRELSIDELTPALNEWYRLSRPFLDPAKKRDDYWAPISLRAWKGSRTARRR
jgi:CHC2 zinc finger